MLASGACDGTGEVADAEGVSEFLSPMPVGGASALVEEELILLGTLVDPAAEDSRIDAGYVLVELKRHRCQHGMVQCRVVLCCLAKAYRVDRRRHLRIRVTTVQETSSAIILAGAIPCLLLHVQQLLQVIVPAFL